MSKQGPVRALERRRLYGSPVTLNRSSTRELYKEVRRLYLRVLPDRPVTRGDCANVERPCPHTSCRYHTYVDTYEADGLPAIRLNFPLIEPHEMPPELSCALDIADAGDHTLEEVADALNLTRQAADQHEKRASASFMKALREQMKKTRTHEY